MQRESDNFHSWKDESSPDSEENKDTHQGDSTLSEQLRAIADEDSGEVGAPDGPPDNITVAPSDRPPDLFTDLGADTETQPATAGSDSEPDFASELRQIADQTNADGPPDYFSAAPEVPTEAISTPRSEAVADLQPEVVLASRSAEMLQPEVLEQRTETALEKCDFEATPELKDGIKSYYEQHYALAAGVETVLVEDPQMLSEEDRAQRIATMQEAQSRPDSELPGFDENGKVEAILGLPAEAGILGDIVERVRLERLKQPDDEHLKHVELLLAIKATHALFAESSIAATTVDAPEIAKVHELSVALKVRLEKANSEGVDPQLPTGSINPDMHELIRDSSSATDISALDHPAEASAQAEQAFWDECRFGGQLMFHNSSEAVSVAATGSILPRRMQRQELGTVTAGTAETTDSGDLHSPTTHWSESYVPEEYKRGENGGTFAVPMSTIVEAAPYGRDSQYGVLTLKESSLKASDKVPRSQGVGKIDAGQADSRGRGGVDRTFYKTAENVDADAPIESAPDGYHVDLGPDGFVVIDSDSERARWEQVALGESSPQLRDLGISAAGAEGAEDRLDIISREVARLQQESIDSQPNTIIAPIRSGGVVKFWVPDDMRLAGRPNARFTKTDKSY
ncbi:MAG: hypothetical protein WCO19_03380 [Candidatus Saccharibacteria bacterium]